MTDADLRIDKIKKGLNQEIYLKMDQFDDLEDETLSSTSKLANILDGYMTQVNEFPVEDENDEIEILDSKEVEVEVNAKNQEILKEYNEEIHDFGIDTLTQLLKGNESMASFEKDDEVQFTDADEVSEIIEQINDYAAQNQIKIEVKSQEEINQNTTTSETVNDKFDDATEKDDIKVVNEEIKSQNIQEINQKSNDKDNSINQKSKVDNNSTTKKSQYENEEINSQVDIVNIILILIIAVILILLVTNIIKIFM